MTAKYGPVPCSSPARIALNDPKFRESSSEPPGEVARRRQPRGEQVVGASGLRVDDEHRLELDGRATRRAGDGLEQQRDRCPRSRRRGRRARTRGQPRHALHARSPGRPRRRRGKGADRQRDLVTRRTAAAIGSAAADVGGSGDASRGRAGPTSARDSARRAADAARAQMGAEVVSRARSTSDREQVPDGVRPRGDRRQGEPARVDLGAVALATRHAATCGPARQRGRSAVAQHGRLQLVEAAVEAEPIVDVLALWP